MNLYKFFKFLLISTLFSLFMGFVLITSTYFYLKPELPSMEMLQDVRFQIPLKVYSKDEKLLAEFGEQRRTPIKYEDVPDLFIKAILAAEDQNFFSHDGVDFKALTRAAKLLIQNKGSKRGGGGSTITMQLTRAIFLNKDQKYKRKFKEIILTYQLEDELSKEEILELYFNEIYLGKRSYGIQAAANVYYNKNIDQLSLAELAMIAGLPKAPAKNNPVNNPERALERRNWILGRMLELSFIDEQQYTLAINEELTAKDYGASSDVAAPYLAEMIRDDLHAKYGDAIYTDGFKAYTTIDSKLQQDANYGVYSGIHAYDERHGYRGVIKNYSIPNINSLKTEFFEKNSKRNFQAEQKIINLSDEKSEQIIFDQRYDFSLLNTLISESNIAYKVYFENTKNLSNLEVALTLFTDELNNTAILVDKNQTIIILEGDQTLWAAPYLDRNSVGEAPKTISQVLKSGDLVYLRKNSSDKWRLAQIPDVQGSLVAIKPDDGAILALVGGYDFNLNKYNRVIQGGRQAGSSIKPFIYTKALEEGFTAATIINDAPVVFDDAALEETWRPENSGGDFYGPTRLRQALYRSRNLVSIRILSKLGINSTIESLERFGFKKEQLPANLSLALGSASLTPMEVTSGFTVFANGGYRVFPYYLDEVKNARNETIFKADPVRVCRECPKSGVNSKINAEQVSDSDTTNTATAEKLNNLASQTKIAQSVIDPRVNYIMDSILADVITRGTGQAALALGRNDIRGKTGTTNDQVDAWFTGYNGNIVASAWMGFDTPQTLGRGEYGAVAALPIWLTFMENALKGTNEKRLPRPNNLVTVKINSHTGEAAQPGDKDAIFEIFLEESTPQLSNTQKNTSIKDDEAIEPEQLF